MTVELWYFTACMISMAAGCLPASAMLLLGYDLEDDIASVVSGAGMLIAGLVQAGFLVAAFFSIGLLKTLGLGAVIGFLNGAVAVAGLYVGVAIAVGLRKALGLSNKHI